MIAKKLAYKVKMQFGNDLSELIELRDKLFKQISETKEEIDRIEHTTRLNGRCRYL